MAKYRDDSTGEIFEAIQWTGDNLDEIKAMSDSNMHVFTVDEATRFLYYMTTNHNLKFALAIGDFVFYHYGEYFKISRTSMDFYTLIE